MLLIYQAVDPFLSAAPLPRLPNIADEIYWNCQRLRLITIGREHAKMTNVNRMRGYSNFTATSFALIFNTMRLNRNRGDDLTA